jgi:hypothetical protein
MVIVVSTEARFFSFPNPVNEVAARTVAAGVGVLAVFTLATRQWWIVLPLFLGFIARVTTGPRFSPLALFATKIVGPRLPSRPVPGPPKRFAQGIGATVTGLAVLLHFAAGADWAVAGLLVLMVVFATLESALGFCVGCRIFNALMRAGMISESVCEECADISRRVAVGAH